MSAVETCPSPETLRQWLLGETAGDERISLALHLEGCDDCRRWLDDSSSPSLFPKYAGQEAGCEDFGPAFFRACHALAAADSQPSGAVADTAEMARPAEMAGPDEIARPERGGLPEGASQGQAPYEPGHSAPRRQVEAGDDSIFARLLDAPTDSRYVGRLGRFDVAEVLGRGGMGIVFRAHDSLLDRDVAIKILSPHLADRRSARERFAREARAAATINHDNVVSIHTVAEAAGLPYLVMPYVVGRSLSDKLSIEGRLPIAEVLRIGAEAARGLAAAHERGIVHRDVKPSNLLLEGPGERVRIVDFGLAFLADGGDLTQTGVVAGTPEYMAPEQARDEAIDARCDLFSLGSVLFAAATGRSPFQATSPLATLRRLCDETPPPISSLNPEATAWLTAVVARLLVKDPADRYQCATDVAETLERQLEAWSQPRRPAPRRHAANPTATEAAPAAVPPAEERPEGIAALPPTPRLPAEPSPLPPEIAAQHVTAPPTIAADVDAFLKYESASKELAELRKKYRRTLSALFAVVVVWFASQFGDALEGLSHFGRSDSPANSGERRGRPHDAGSHGRGSQTASSPRAARPLLEPVADLLEQDVELTITRVAPQSGPAATIVRIAGHGFTDTRHVRFCVGRDAREATFAIVDDGILSVTVPEPVRDGALAMIVIETDRGVVASVPELGRVVEGPDDPPAVPDDLSFTYVGSGGTTGFAQGVVLVDQGGALAVSQSSPAPAGQEKQGPYFVRRGGSFDANLANVVYHEPGVVFGPNVGGDLRRIATPRIILSPAGFFRYTAAKVAWSGAAPAMRAEASRFNVPLMGFGQRVFRVLESEAKQ